LLFADVFSRLFFGFVLLNLVGFRLLV